VTHRAHDRCDVAGLLQHLRAEIVTGTIQDQVLSSPAKAGEFEKALT
jgi:hypothetical protein